MKTIIVQYTVKDDFVETNKANIAKVMSDLKAQNAGVHYFTSVKEDGKTFVHVAIDKAGEIDKTLNSLDSFNSFRAALKEGASVPPQATYHELVGKSFDL